MGVEGQGSKVGGGYVGGFLHLFDWNAKSRKKLFSSKSDLPEQLKQKKRSDVNLPMTQFHVMDEDEIVAGSSVKGSSDYSYASSITDEEVCRNKAPGVVARLMGLDSLPTSNFSEPYSTPYFDSQSLRDAHSRRKNLEFHYDHQIMHSGNLHHKVDRNAMEPKPQKMISRPIEKFQTEVLPPKSAKSIPITQHKLLSPIKSPCFVPSNNAAHIMEAAAKIIELGHQATTKPKMPLVGSSSVPLKVRDLKEKAEAAKKPSKPQRPVESNAAKYLKGQSMNRSWNGSGDTKSLTVSSDSAEYSASVNNKGKSISLAVQAKVNVQKREGLNPSGSRSSFGQQSEITSSQPFKSQPNAKRNTHKKPSTHNTSNVLKQNNLKQNCLVDRGKLPSESLASSSNSQGRKALSRDSSFGRQKSSNKLAGNSRVSSRNLGLEVNESKKEVSFSRTKTVTRKKRSIDGDFHFENNQAVDNFDKIGKAIQSNVLMNRQFSWADDSDRKGMDVVSFTFTAPMARSLHGPETTRERAEKNNGFCADYQGRKVLLNSQGTNGSEFSSLGYNAIGGDALSTLLEQKLRELTQGVEFSHNKTGTAGSSASIFPDLLPEVKAVNTTPMYNKWSQNEIHTDRLGHPYSSSFSSTDPQGLTGKHKPQGMQEMDECCRNDSETRKLLNYRHPSPISVLEPSFFTESCNSSDTTGSNSTEASKQCSSVQAQEVFGIGSSKKFHLMEADTELSDSASSTSSRIVARKHVTASSMTDVVGSTMWELEYVKEILCNVELMFKDFAFGRAREIINPHLFDQLENRRVVLGSHGDEPKLRRKVLFDCVSECLDLRCRRYVGGGYKAWAKGLSMVRRKQWLAEEVYKEISGWEGMGDCMVDELVDKDMSSQYGRWLDFEVESFELGVQIEGRILNSLINEVVANILRI